MSEIGGTQDAIEQQNRRLVFAKKVLPWMLKVTSGRPIVAQHFSTHTGPLTLRRNHPKGQPIILHSEKDVYDWMNRTGRFEKCGTGCFTKGFMTLFVELNHTEPLEIGIFDFDIKDVSEKDVRPFVKKVNRILIRKGFVTMIMFTGSSYHVWFRR